jgi:hypothetical protein
MKKTKINDPVIQSFVHAYTVAAAKHGQATRESDPETGNEQAEVIEGVYHELRALGRDAQLQLLDLLDNSNPSVRLWAASHALEFAPEQGKPALEELLDYDGWIGITAEITLEEWSKGTLRFP